MKTSEYEKLDKALYIWSSQQRELVIPISTALLQEKVKVLFEGVAIS